MEIVNFIFGHSRGEYPVDRSKMEKVYKWEELCDRVGLDGYGFYNGKWGSSYRANIGGFKNDTFEVTPYFWGDCESHDDYDDSFDENCEKCKVKECFIHKPNFIYFPQNFSISWYKYPWRDSYSSLPLDVLCYNEMFQKCIDSLQLDKEQQEKEVTIQSVTSHASKIFLSETGESFRKKRYLTFRIPVQVCTLYDPAKLINTIFREMNLDPSKTSYASVALQQISKLPDAVLRTVNKFEDDFMDITFDSPVDM